MGFSSICIQSATDIENFKKAGFHNMQQTKYLVWGEYYKKLFKKISPKLNTVVVGNFLIDKKLDKKKKNIGIILQLRNSKVPKKLLDDFKELIKWLSIYYQANIIIRPHPRDREDYYNLNELIKDRNITIHHPDNYTIGQTLRKCSIIIAK